MKEIGYWRKTEDSNEDLPWPIIRKLPPETKQKIKDFLEKGELYAAWRGSSSCRICGKTNGSTCLKNGNFIYPEGYLHYILDHDVMVDSELLAKIL